MAHVDVLPAVDAADGSELTFLPHRAARVSMYLQAFNGDKLPKLAVFDLDYTLWWGDCGKDMQAPYTYCQWAGILDKWGAPANPYADVRGIMATLVDHGIPIAIASRNPDFAEVSNLLRTIKFACKKGSMSIYDAVGNPAYIHAYSSGGCGGKTKHFTALRQVSGVDFSQMIFFDDLEENIHFAERLGITSVLLRHRIGLTWESMIAGLMLWRSKHVVPEAEAVATAVAGEVEAEAKDKV